MRRFICMRRPGPRLADLVLSEYEGQVLSALVRAQSAPRALALRAQIVLACSAVAPDGLPRSATAVARQLGVAIETVSKWRARFVVYRLDGLEDAPGPARRGDGRWRTGRRTTVFDAHPEAGIADGPSGGMPQSTSSWTLHTSARASPRRVDRTV